MPRSRRMEWLLLFTSKRPQAWHERAKYNIRMQAGALGVTSAMYATGVAKLQLTRAGGNTPLTPYSIMVSSKRRMYTDSW